MGPLRVIMTIVLVIAELFLIAVVLLQSGKSAGLSGSIAGGAETFFGKHKAKSYEGKLQFLTKVAALAFIIIAVLLALLQ
ncbi:MAG: preprotein translocase subunit SecG [Caldicoprobacterales bacterium]|jgi:preprotein translocase subunit SecG|nr:preprotein translocase subunit SecG [Clostridiales bacterium]